VSSGVSACGFAVAEVFAGHAEIAASRRRRPRHLRAGGLLTEAVTEAVRAASEFVARGGASAAPSLAVPPEPGRPSADAAPAGSAWDLVADVRQRGGRIVATGGCFDLLHAGHVGCCGRPAGWATA